VRRVYAMLCIAAMLCAAFPLATGPVYGKHGGQTIPGCDSTANQTWFQAGGTRVMVCPSTVVSGQPVRFTVHTRRAAAVTVTLSFPDDSSTDADATANGQGTAVIEMPVQYNPINRYAQAQFTVTAATKGHSDQVPGTLTIAQASPLSDVQLRARPHYQSHWCPATQEACRVRNNTTIIIQVNSTAGAQVSVNLQYPDGQPISCPANDLTNSTFADSSGVYRCELPVSFQTKLIRGGVKIEISAQVSAGGFTVNPSITMSLVAH
ncbi:MAG: hypothetical protein ACRDG4_13640, partial [Chloroflexota bacterium]